MKLGKNSRKKLKAVRRALMLGLPVAGLLATAGCEREKDPLDVAPISHEEYERTHPRTLGVVRPHPRDGQDRLGGEFSDVK